MAELLEIPGSTSGFTSARNSRWHNSGKDSDTLATARLIVRSSGSERIVPLPGDGPSRIGRSSQNEIVLESERVSRVHAMLQKNENGNYSLFDLGSRNGTLLNNRRLAAPEELHEGDTISIGEFVLTFSEEEQIRPTAAPARATISETVTMFALRTITVLVIDIRGFTTLSRVLGEERIASVVAKLNREAGAILQRYGAWTIKYIGDAVMAVWVHQAGQSAVSVLTSVLISIAELKGIVSRLQDEFSLSIPIDIGAGINSGIASIGNLGSGLSADHTALGDVVNKAFRLEASTRQLNAAVAFGSEVRDLLSGEIALESCTEHHSVLLKGYAEPCDVYALSMDDFDRLLNNVRGL